MRVVDTKWTDHIDAMDQLRQSVGLRAYGQNNPLVEYQTEGYSMYNNMVGSIEYEVTRLFMKSEIRQNVQREQVAQGQAEHPETEQDAAAQSNTSAKRQPVRVDKKWAVMIYAHAEVAKIQKLSWKKRLIKEKRRVGQFVPPLLFTIKERRNHFENPEIRTLLDEMTQKLLASGGLFDLDQLEEDIAEAENRMGEPGFGTTQKRLKS